nr:palladin-like [Meriones unguiculatus]
MENRGSREKPDSNLTQKRSTGKGPPTQKMTPSKCGLYLQNSEKESGAACLPACLLFLTPTISMAAPLPARSPHRRPSALKLPAHNRRVPKEPGAATSAGACRACSVPSRWFCEGKELYNSPDIQIHCEGGELHTLVIAEAFEDDTGRYTCLATNPSGSDTTSAEVFIEGASSTDSDSESLPFVSKAGAMPQAQKKTTSVSLTIGSSSPKTGVTTAVIQPLSVPVQQVHSPTSYLCRPDGTAVGCLLPVFTKELQNTAASEGQVVVLECRVRGAPPLQVQWFRQGREIQDSPDFRILQKKPRSTAEPVFYTQTRDPKEKLSKISADKGNLLLTRPALRLHSTECAWERAPVNPQAPSTCLEP